MALVETPCCPRCGEHVNYTDLLREFARRSSWFDGTKWGIRCPRCQFVSKIHRARAYAASAVVTAIMMIVALLLKGSFSGLSGNGESVVFVALILVAIFVQLRWATLLIQLEAPGPGESLRLPEV